MLDFKVTKWGTNCINKYKYIKINYESQFSKEYKLSNIIHICIKLLGSYLWTIKASLQPNTCLNKLVSTEKQQA